MNTIDSVLKFIKQKMIYAIQAYYGHEIGADDFDLDEDQMPVAITGVPVGTLGGVRIVWNGTYKELKAFDFEKNYTKECFHVLNNPPGDAYKGKCGFFVWGEQELVDKFLERIELRP